MPPVHDIARENGEAISPQKGGNELYNELIKYSVLVNLVSCFDQVVIK